VSQQIFSDEDQWVGVLNEYLATPPDSQGDTVLGQIMQQNGVRDPLTFIEEQSSHYPE
jgi:hypothetical protein